MKLGKIQVFNGKVNVTLQAAAKIICGSLNELSHNGVAIPCGVSAPWLQDISYVSYLCSGLHTYDTCQLFWIYFPL
jgi:hypothetical protein